MDRPLLDDLWYSYQMENVPYRDKEADRLLETLASSENKLRRLLSEEQYTEFERYENCLKEIHSKAELTAFSKGVRFATRYLAEVLYNERGSVPPLL